MQDKQYTKFYSGFRHYAQSHGFLITQHLIDEITPSGEMAAFMEINPLHVKGVACISVAAETILENTIYKKGTSEVQVLFVEHNPSFKWAFISFNHEKAGQDMACKVLQLWICKKRQGHLTIFLVRI